MNFVDMPVVQFKQWSKRKLPYVFLIFLLPAVKLYSHFTTKDKQGVFAFFSGNLANYLGAISIIIGVVESWRRRCFSPLIFFGAFGIAILLIF